MSRILTGDCVELMATLEAESVDAIVTDPPYGITFMGKAWDGPAIEASARADAQKRVLPEDDGERHRTKSAYGNEAGYAGAYRFDLKGNQAFQTWCTAWATEAFRVAKPGAHLLAFGGTRTYHRLASAIEDAGWEIRDCLVWAYASGFPKSHNLNGDWQGWGTALKPAWEPIVMARKPLVGTVAANVLKWGTGALNIDATRIGYEAGGDAASNPAYRTANGYKQRAGTKDSMFLGTTELDMPANPAGRWPANLILTDPIFDGGVDGVVGGGRQASVDAKVYGAAEGKFKGNTEGHVAYHGVDGAWVNTYGDAGTYSRFFELPKEEGRCRWCGVTIAELSSDQLNRSGSSAPSGVATSPDGTKAASTDPVTPERSGGTSTTTASGETSLQLEAGIVTEQNPTSRSRGARRGGTFPMASARSKAATSQGTGTTTTTPDRWTCASCAEAITSGTTSVWQPDANYPRVFLIPKAARSDREPVLRGQVPAGGTGLYDDDGYRDPGERKGDHTARGARENAHPTVKPVELMRHLVRLVTPPGGTVLDCFLGSGTTAIACELEGFAWIGIEKEAEYVAIAEARLNGTQRGMAL